MMIEEVVESANNNIHALSNAWDVYYHLCTEKAWDLGSYNIIQKKISCIEEVLFLSELINEQFLKKCMFFVMRTGITPQWEDPKNRNGGCFSLKIHFKHVESVWKRVLFASCGECIFIDAKNQKTFNGVTISPKKNFCIIKIWMSDCTVQDASSLLPIENMNLSGCLFNKHEPEF